MHAVRCMIARTASRLLMRAADRPINSRAISARPMPSEVASVLRAPAGDQAEDRVLCGRRTLFALIDGDADIRAGGRARGLRLIIARNSCAERPSERALVVVTASAPWRVAISKISAAQVRSASSSAVSSASSVSTSATADLFDLCGDIFDLGHDLSDLSVIRVFRFFDFRFQIFDLRVQLFSRAADDQALRAAILVRAFAMRLLILRVLFGWR